MRCPRGRGTGLAPGHGDAGRRRCYEPDAPLAYLTREHFAGVYVSSEYLQDALELGNLLQNQQVLEGMPDGVALLDAENAVVWCNARLCEWSECDAVIGKNFYTVLGSPEILGPDFCPFHTALATGQATSSTLRCGDNRYYQVHAAPSSDAGPAAASDRHRPRRDQRNAPAAEAGGDSSGRHRTGRSRAGELSHMTVEERIELLKSNILHFTRDLLHFDVVEIRLLDAKTGRLEPLLAWA